MSANDNGAEKAQATVATLRDARATFLRLSEAYEGMVEQVAKWNEQVAPILDTWPRRQVVSRCVEQGRQMQVLVAELRNTYEALANLTGALEVAAPDGQLFKVGNAPDLTAEAIRQMQSQARGPDPSNPFEAA